MEVVPMVETTLYKGELSMSREIAMIRRRALLGVATGLLALGSSAAVLRQAHATVVERRLEELGINMPAVPATVANYVPYVVTGNLVYLAGQIAFKDGALLHPGTVPGEVSIEQAQFSARQCAINLIAALKDACKGDLDRVKKCVRVDGFVASADDFFQQPTVMNGASDLMVDVFGDSGRHTRTAIGVNVLPLNACVEVAAVFEVG